MRVVGAIIRNQLGEFLLQLRDANAPSFPDYWTIFGGVVEGHESPRAALCRELWEELHLGPDRIESFRHVAEHLQENGTKQSIFEVVVSSDTGDLALREGAGMAFVGIVELFDRRLAFNVRDVLREYLADEHRGRRAA